MIPKYLYDFLMGKLIMSLKFILKFRQVLQLHFLYLQLHLFPSVEGLLQFLGHSLSHLLLPLYLLLGDLDYYIEIYLYALHEPQAFLELFVELLDTVVVDSVVGRLPKVLLEIE